jgi:hypothetical protein
MRSTCRPVLPAALAVLILVACPWTPAGAWDVNPATGPGSLVDFHEQFSLMAYPYPRHKAEPLGWVGFEIYGEVAALPGAADDTSIRNATDGSLPADALSVYRVGARKGLPGKVDLGASLAKTLDGDIDLVSAELSWAILEGSVATPALQLRLTGTQTLDADLYDLEMYGAELLLSKGFPIVTPYVGAGVVYSEGTFDRSTVFGAVPETFTTDGTHTVGYVGATFNFALFKITAEVERGVEVHGAVRFSVGIR